MHNDIQVYLKVILDSYSDLRTWYHLLLLCCSTSSYTYDSADSIKCNFLSQMSDIILVFKSTQDLEISWKMVTFNFHKFLCLKKKGKTKKNCKQGLWS